MDKTTRNTALYGLIEATVCPSFVIFKKEMAMNVPQFEDSLSALHFKESFTV